MRRAWFLLPFVVGFGVLAAVSVARHEAERRDLVRYERALAQAEAAQRPRPRGRTGGGRWIQPVTLSGPGGSVQIPGSEAMVVNVWLQACPDCMPRFNAAKKLLEAGESWPEATVNVAYQRADPRWAKRYGLDQGLVVDRGQAIVNPLRIGTFTTLVVDREGQVVHTDYADRPGFLARVEDALARADAPPPPAINGPAGVPAATPSAPPPPPPPPPQPSIFEDRRALFGIGLMVIGVLGGLAQLFRAGATAGSDFGGPIQPWQEDLVVAGRRCVSCAGRFDEPSEVTRCGACEAAYHRSCARRERTCSTPSCGKRL